MTKRKKVAPELYKLKGRITEKKYSQRSLSKELGISTTTLSSIIKGYSIIGADKIDLVADLLDITLEELPSFFFPGMLCNATKRTY